VFLLIFYVIDDADCRNVHVTDVNMTQTCPSFCGQRNSRTHWQMLAKHGRHRQRVTL